MIRTRHATDAAVAVTVAQTTVAAVPAQAVPVLSEAATDLDTLAAQVVADIAAIKLELAALRVKQGI